MSEYLNPTRRAELLGEYRDRLVGEILPFWLTHGLDREHGGILTALGRKGEILDTDKSVWFQGRAGWMFATMYNTTPEKRPEYLEAAVSCCEFLRTKCYAPNGKLYFTVTREGKPLRMRRYVYSESFAAIAFAATHKATGKPEYRDLGIKAFETYLNYSFKPGMIPAKSERAGRGIGSLMIGIVTAQEMRANLGDIAVDGKTCTQLIAGMIAEIEKYFVKPELKVVMECVGPNGEIIDHFDGRLLNPGHSIEAAWFILHEAKHTGNEAWKKLGLTILDWMWERGWDKQFGGLLYFADVYGKPIQEYWHFMKFWWPHNEAVIATLLAYTMTGDKKYADMHRQVHEWTYKHFPDKEHGEWYGYLDRAGNPTTELKGNMWKGPFHMPRMKWYCWKLLEA